MCVFLLLLLSALFIFYLPAMRWENVQFTKMCRTKLGVFPSTLIPLTSQTSSPTWMRPDRSAAPPCIIRAITILPVISQVFMVAP